MFTLPIDFMHFLPSFCFSSNFRLRVMSPLAVVHNQSFVFCNVRKSTLASRLYAGIRTARASNPRK